MIGTLTEVSFAKVSFLVVGAFVSVACGSAVARAAEPDIPRIQADAERGSVQQEIQLAAAYLFGRGVVRDEKQAAYWYEKAANSGDPGAQQQIGYFYQAGIGVERNPARGAEWFERAIAGGLISAKVNLGVAYMWGLGLRKDPEFAVQLFREAAKKGNGTAACYLGDSYYFGVGVAKDAPKAMHWFEVGAKLHDPRARYNLAIELLRKTGRGDNERAIKLLRESAEGGYVPAKHQLALQIIRNSDPASPSHEALDLLQEASSEGFWKSTLVLGILDRDGRGVAKDKEAAYYHFRAAELQGGENAARLLANDMRILTSELGESKLQALNEKAAAWVKNHDRPLEYAYMPGTKTKDLPAFVLANPEEGNHSGMLVTQSDNALEDVGNTFVR